jgi:hypothetical protein
MPLPHSAKLPPPKSEEEFEDLVADLLQHLWGCGTTRNGRRGQRQKGVDIFGKPSALAGRYAGAQCKNTRTLTADTVLEEGAKAAGFQPTLARFLVVTSAEADADEQEELRLRLSSHALPFDVEVLYWADACRAMTQELVRKYWPSWHVEPRCGPYRAEPQWLSEPTVSDALLSTAMYRGLLSDSEEDARIIEELKESVRSSVDTDLRLSAALEHARVDKLDERVIRFLDEEAKAWQRALLVIDNDPQQDPCLELTFCACTEEAELDVGIRNLSGDDAIIDQVVVTVLKDYGYVAPTLTPSARYTLPVSDLSVGQSRKIEIRQVVEAHKADRFLIDLEDMRTLLLHVRFRTNGEYCLSGFVWLFGGTVD